MFLSVLRLMDWNDQMTKDVWIRVSEIENRSSGTICVNKGRLHKPVVIDELEVILFVSIINWSSLDISLGHEVIVSNWKSQVSSETGLVVY